MKTTRRDFIRCLIAGSMTSTASSTVDAETTPWYELLAGKAKEMASGKPLRILIPNGSYANIQAATSLFTKLSGVQCIIEEVPIDDINVELILRTNSDKAPVDLALPATFGLADLVQANAIANLDEFVVRHQPAEFYEDYLYRKGDVLNGSVYGYQTDGDVYMLFYNKAMLEDPQEQSAYRELTGKPLEPARSWEDLDSMMAFFNRPDQGTLGGVLYRNPEYPIWEWWARFHAKGSLPFDSSMHPQINTKHGVDALNELLAASKYQSPGAQANGIFDNWTSFAKGNIFCNLGWGGTQKFLRTHENMRDNIVVSALPGPSVNGSPSKMGYFNWGWNYTVSSSSTQKELAFLLALFCTTPTVSTLSIREADGFFDPFRQSHYNDETVQAVYGASFIAAQKESLANCVPDLYIRGQTSYLDILRQQILAAMNEEYSAQESLDICAQKWTHVTRKLGRREQQQQWQDLLASYPEVFRT